MPGAYTQTLAHSVEGASGSNSTQPLAMARLPAKNFPKQKGPNLPGDCSGAGGLLGEPLPYAEGPDVAEAEAGGGGAGVDGTSAASHSSVKCVYASCRTESHRHRFAR